MGFFTAFPLDVYAQNTRPEVPASGGFTLATALTMAWAAQAAYEVPDRAKLEAVLGGWNWRMLDMFDKPVPGAWPRTGAKGFVARAGDALVVSIAGTEPNSMGNWAQNFDFPVDANGAHRGFQDGAKVALAAISARLAAEPGPVYLTGHSLGGVIAAMTAMLMPSAPIGVYTIGMPRPGNAAYRAAYNPLFGSRTYRLIYGDDLVPKVPPSAFGFRHVGALLRCPRGGSFEGEPAIPPDEAASLGELREIALSPFGINKAPPFPAQEKAAAFAVGRLSAPIRDHLPDGYLRALTPPPTPGAQSSDLKGNQ